MPEYISKVIVGSETKLDLSSDTITAESLLSGHTAHGHDGAPITGSCPFTVDDSSANAKEAEVLSGIKFASSGSVKTGSMPNNGGNGISVKSVVSASPIPRGYYDGSGKASIDSAEAEKFIPENIRDGVTLMGIVGNMSGTEGAKPQAKTVTPSLSRQVVSPDSPQYNFLSSVTVNPIPVNESPNPAGGITLKIG